MTTSSSFASFQERHGRGTVAPVVTTRLSGTVASFIRKRGFGFVKAANPLSDKPKLLECFVHYRDIVSEGYNNLFKGDVVLYNPVAGIFVAWGVT